MRILWYRWMKLMLFCLFLGNNLSWAESKIGAFISNASSQLIKSSDTDSSSTAPLTDETLSLKAIQANWVFSGTVMNENGEYYNYFFQMRRQGTQMDAVAALINDQNKQVILFEEHRANNETPEENHWRAGNAFLKYNPINNSWIFGVRGKNKTGFNFKVDMLSQPTGVVRHKVLTLRPGINFLINQTGRLNGHLQLGERSEGRDKANKDSGSGDQFITGNTAWFRQIWVSQPQKSLHPFQNILCQFKEGDGFFSLNLTEEDAIMGSIAGWRDPKGASVRMSQFVAAQELKPGEWHIDISTPKLQIFFQNVLAHSEKKDFIMGAMENKPGFCVINNDSIG